MIACVGARVASKPKTTASPVVSKPTPSPAKCTCFSREDSLFVNFCFVFCFWCAAGGVPAWKQKQLDEEKAREQQLKREQEELAKRQAAIQVGECGVGFSFVLTVFAMVCHSRIPTAPVHRLPLHRNLPLTMTVR